VLEPRALCVCFSQMGAQRLYLAEHLFSMGFVVRQLYLCPVDLRLQYQPPGLQGLQIGRYRGDLLFVQMRSFVRDGLIALEPIDLRLCGGQALCEAGLRGVLLCYLAAYGLQASLELTSIGSLPL